MNQNYVYPQAAIGLVPDAAVMHRVQRRPATTVLHATCYRGLRKHQAVIGLARILRPALYLLHLDLDLESYPLPRASQATPHEGGLPTLSLSIQRLPSAS